MERIEEILKSYQIKAKSAERMNSGLANLNYLVIDSHDNRRFLKIYRNPDITLVEHEINFMQYLAETGFPVPKIIKNLSDSLITQQDKNIAVLYAFIEGAHPKQTKETIAAIGKLISNLHNQKYDSKNRNPYADNLPVIRQGIDRYREMIPDDLISFLNRVIDLTDQIPFEKLPKNFIHCDIFLDNMIETKDGIYLIDFEELSYDNMLFDMSRAVFGCCLADNKVDLELVSILVSEYQKYRQLEELEKQCLYEYILYTGLISLFWRYKEFNIIRKDEGKNMLYAEFEIAIKSILDISNVRLGFCI